jgi:RHS repeat-associated protein
MLLDMNGDGLPDRVEYAYPGNNNYYVVELSSGPFPDLMIAASNGLGGIVNATYKPATKWDNRASTNTSPAQYLLPFPLYTVSSLSVSDGVYPSNTTTYSYTGGYWNYAQHQFNGFAQTTVSDPLNMTNVHWFHQAGGRNNSAFGEYQDSTTAIGKTGMEYRTDTIGSDGKPYRTLLNQVNETVVNTGEHFAYVTTNIQIDYPAASSSYKATATVNYFNLNNGNLTGVTDWGQVTVSLPPGSEVFSDVAGDTVYQLITYASLSNPNIVDKPQTVTLSLDSAGANILRQENYTYNGSTGVTLQENDLICSGSYRTTSYGYDNYNNKNSETDPTGVVTQTTYDSTYETFPVTTTEGGTFTTSTTYDPRSGRLYLFTDPAGLVTSNRYDVFLRLAETYVSTTPNGSPTEWLDQYTYTLGVSGGPQNSVLRQQSDGVDLSNGHESITWSDGLGRPIQTRVEAENGQYRVVDTAYDQRGNTVFVSLPYFSSSGTSRTSAASGLGTLHGYDPIGRQIQVTASVNGTFSSGVLTGTSATGGDSGSPIGTASLAYYSNNDPWTWMTTDETGSVHYYTRDAYGRTNQIVEVNGSQSYTTLLNWNLAGDLLSVTDNSNNVIQYSNNLMGEVVAMADPDMGVWTYQRDYAGRLRVQTDGDGQAIHFNYSPDPLGRLLSRQVYDLKGSFYYGITNIYDSSTDGNFTVYPGQLYETIDGEGYTKNGYDVRGRKVITARYLARNGNTYTNRYTFDDMGRVRSIVYPSNGPTITNIYDTGANLSQVQQVGGTTFYQTTSTSFTPLDQLAEVYYGNGVTATYSYYGNSKRLESAVTSGGLQNLSYTYDQVADILSISDGIGTYSGAASASITSVSYDNLHRLLGFNRPGTSQTVSCTYDAIGDMLTYSENGSVAYTYLTPTGTHLPHAIKSANGLNYTYDLCGNMLTRGSQALVYNPENRLIGSAVSNQSTTFGYDAGGNRLWKQGAPTNTLQVWIGGNYEEKDGKILFHISAGDRMVYTYSSDGSVAEYYHPDHLHSAQVMSTTGGGLYQHYEYAAYGNSRYTYSATAFPISRRYTSQVLDEETGLYYFGARYYDPVIGRFIQPDTMIANRFDPQAYDRYAYARDNPLEYVDPNGHAWQIFSGEYWKNLAHRLFIGGNGTPQLDPNSEQALASAAGIGPTQLTDENGNPISGGQATIQVGMAVVNGVLQTGMMLTGEGEAEGVVKAGEEVVQGEKAAGAAAKLEDAGTASLQGQKGSYVHEFKSGKKYIGKGTEKRMKQSAKDVAEANNDKVVKSQFEPSDPNTDEQAFKDEAQKIKDSGGVPNKTLYNKINSPGKKDLPPPPPPPAEAAPQVTPQSN